MYTQKKKEVYRGRRQGGKEKGSKCDDICGKRGVLHTHTEQQIAITG